MKLWWLEQPLLLALSNLFAHCFWLFLLHYPCILSNDYVPVSIFQVLEDKIWESQGNIIILQNASVSTYEIWTCMLVRVLFKYSSIECRTTISTKIDYVHAHAWWNLHQEIPSAGYTRLQLLAGKSSDWCGLEFCLCIHHNFFLVCIHMRFRQKHWLF